MLMKNRTVFTVPMMLVRILFAEPVTMTRSIEFENT
jgi:hypothetical protein